MLTLVTKLRGFSLKTEDGERGEIIAVLFDDRDYNAGYLVVDTEEWPASRNVLISTEAIEPPNMEERTVPTNLTQSRILDAPAIDLGKPISEQDLADLHRYYEWSTFRPGVLPDEAATVPGTTMPDPSTPDYVITDESRTEEHVAPEPERHLRNTLEVDGYTLEIENEELGVVEDFLLDVDDWVLRYFIVDVGSRFGGAELALPSQWVESIDYSEQSIFVNLTEEELETAPRYDKGAEFTREDEIVLYEHYDKEPYWRR